MKLNLINSAKLIMGGVRNLSFFLRSKRNEPAFIVWLPSHNCNLKCRHCTAHLDVAPIDKDAVLATTRKIAASRVFGISLSGGEPLIIPNIKEVITILKQAGKFVNINTNALLLDRYNDLLIEQKVDVVTISMDGYNAEMHDHVRQKEGLFDKCISNIKYLRKHRRGLTPEIRIRGVFMQDNYRDIGKYMDFFRPLAEDVDFQPIHTTKHFGVGSEEVLFQQGQEKLITEEIENLIRAYRELDNDYFKSFGTFLFHPEKMEKRVVNHCIPILFLSLFIKPDGSCWTCNRNVGNINTQTLRDIWNGSERRAFLKELATSGRCPHPCWTNNSAVANPLPGKIIKTMIKVAG